jgi:acetylornithine aminotransferase
VPSTPTTVPHDAQALKDAIVTAEAKYVLQTYGRPPDIVMTHGQGCKVYDISGKEYIDFAAGIAVNALGHSDPRWVEAITAQAQLLGHTSNLFHTIPQVQIAERLVENSFADKVFFCNSGTEANEACIKFARKFARLQAGVDPQNPDATAAPTGFVAFTNSFHGRTMGALALTAKTKYQNPFLPTMPGVTQVRAWSLGWWQPLSTLIVLSAR